MTKDSYNSAVPSAPLSGTDWGFLLLIWAAATACNLFKPYHIDDTAHLLIAQWIIHHPLHPMSGMLNWSGALEPIYKTNQPHLYFYLLAFWIHLFGTSEPATHALESLATLACVLLFFRIARRLVPAVAMWATAVVILGPAFVVEQNLMVDDPLLALWLAFFGLLLCDLGHPRQTRRFMLAALCCSAALLIKYSSLVLFLILCFALLAERRKAQAWTALIPLAVLAAWSGFNYLDYGGIHMAARQGSSHHHATWIVHFAGQWLLGLGGLTPLGLLAAARYRPRRLSEGGALAMLALAFALFLLAVETGVVSDRWSVILLAIAFGLSGLLVFFVLFAYTRRLLQEQPWLVERWRQVAPACYLLLWVFVTTAFYIVLSPFIAARHILLILPAVTVLVLMYWQTALSPAMQRFGLAVTLLVSLGLSISDWRFAAFLRNEAVALPDTLPHGTARWTNAHWGWQWYAEKSGIVEYSTNASLSHVGDLLLTPREAFPSPIEGLEASLVRTDTEARNRLDPFCIGQRVDFYAASHLRGPWQLSSTCVFHVDIFRITAIPASK